MWIVFCPNTHTHTGMVHEHKYITHSGMQTDSLTGEDKARQVEAARQTQADKQQTQADGQKTN